MFEGLCLPAGAVIQADSRSTPSSLRLFCNRWKRKRACSNNVCQIAKPVAWLSQLKVDSHRTLTT